MMLGTYGGSERAGRGLVRSSATAVDAGKWETHVLFPRADVPLPDPPGREEHHRKSPRQQLVRDEPDRVERAFVRRHDGFDQLPEHELGSLFDGLVFSDAVASFSFCS